MKPIQNNITFIFGMSGCAKTTTAIKLICSEQFQNFLCLAYTHSAVNNLIDKFKTISNSKFNLQIQNHFMTIHQALRLKIDKNTNETIIVKHKSYPHITNANIIIIDEFSLIPMDIIEYLFELANIYKDVKWVFVGDFIQLGSIESFDKIGDINVNKLIDAKIDLPVKTTFYESLKIADHLYRSCYINPDFIKSNKIILLYNYRCNDNVHFVLNQCLNNNFNLPGITIQLKDIQQFIDKGYIVLASMYKYLAAINSIIIKDSSIPQIKTKIGNSSINQDFILLKNINKSYHNGDIIRINEKYEIEGTEIVITPNDIIPANLSTIHKSQGRTIKNIIVVLDNLFEITMLYTAITRAQNDVKLLLLSDENKPKDSDISAFKIMRDYIYSENQNNVSGLMY